MTDSIQVDVAVIGAGMAGLICAQQLVQAGYSVVVLEKSRGVGGRIATRRLQGTIADHGTCYVTPKGTQFKGLVEQLNQLGVLQVWTDTVHELDRYGTLHQSPDRYPRYVAPQGMTAISKHLATGLTVQLNQRVERLTLHDRQWQLEANVPNGETAVIAAGAVVVAVPAPQAVALLEPLTTVLSNVFIQRLQSVEFLPCLSVMAGYSNDRQHAWQTQFPDVKSLTFVDDPALAWLGLDSSKRSEASIAPVLVIQSTAAFASDYLEVNDLAPAADQLLQQASKRCTDWLATPEWYQIHRWRYAFARSPLANAYLAADTPVPLVCAGDWCGGAKVEQALLSGMAAAEHLLTVLK